MSYARSRSRTVPNYAEGRLYRSLTKTWTRESLMGNEVQTCTDVVGNWKGDNAFRCERHGAQHVCINGRTASGSYIWQNVPTQAGAYSGPNHWMSPEITDSELNNLAMSTVAKTNVNNPSVSIPMWAASIGEFPAMVRSYGFDHMKGHLRYPGLEGFARDASERYLQARWGWAQAVSDVKKMWQFAEGAERRFRQIRALASGETIRRNVTLSQIQDWGYATNTLIYSTGITVNTGQRVVTTAQKTWGSCHWSPDESLARFGYELPNSETSQREAAALAEWGLTPQAMTLAVWDKIPWSWLADWFTGFGTLLEACQNTIPVQHSRINVMRRTETIELAPHLYSNAAKGSITFAGNWRRYRVTKVRRPAPNPAPLTISFEALTEPNKWAILGSLAILRRVPLRQAI